MGKYNRELVLRKLMRKGVKLKPSPKQVAYLEIPARVQLGLKSWSMIDFLKIDVRHQQPKEKKKSFLREPSKKKVEIKEDILGECKICKKAVSNINGFFRFYKNYKYIKLHSRNCANKHNLIINTEISKRRKI